LPEKFADCSENTHIFAASFNLKKYDMKKFMCKKMIVLSVLILTLLMPFTAFAQFSGGDGTENNPYIITTPAQLAQLATYVNEDDFNSPVWSDKHYKLENDIDLSDYGENYNNEAGWIPIGIDYIFPFKGVFDGNGKIITNLYIRNVSRQYGGDGLFGFVEGGVIKNFGVVNADITIIYNNGNSNAGVIAGYINNSIIFNCYSTGAVSASSHFTSSSAWASNAGGVVGYVRESTISNCYSKVLVSALSAGVYTSSSRAGGVAGYIVYSTVNNCYATGLINASSSGVYYYDSIAGGVVGHSSLSTISNCVALNTRTNCTVSSNFYFGRVVGISEILNDNIGFKDMLNPYGETTWDNIGSSYKDGADISIELIHTDGTFGGRFTNANGWTVENGKLPGLFGSVVEMPEHLIPTPPVITTIYLLNGSVSETYNQTLIATGEVPITWSLESGALPNGLNLSSSGIISGIPTTAGTSNFTVKATNNLGYDTKNLSITVNAPPIITTTNLPDGFVGVEYIQNLTADGDLPIEWSMFYGWLPAGLNLSEDGIISGIPTTTGTFDFTVKAENIAGFDTKDLSIAINTQPIIITTNNLPNGEIGEIYYQTLAATGNVIMWSLESGILPPGLNLYSNGMISGIPIVEGTFFFTVKTTNCMGFATKELSIIVTLPGFPTIITTSLPNGEVDEAYYEILEVISDTPVTWSLDSGSLPIGLNITSSGVILGVPTIEGEFNFTVKATNDVGYDTKELEIIIGNVGMLEKTSKESLTAYFQNKILYVFGLTPNESLFVYDLSGRLIYENFTTESFHETYFQVNNGVYIVKSGNRTAKLVIIN